MRGAAPLRSPAPTQGTEAKPSRPLPQPEQTEEIFRQLRLHVSPGTRHAVIQLMPLELGRISIRITVKGSRVTGEIRADSSDTLERLEAHGPELRAVLAHSGFETTDLSFGRHGEELPAARSANSPLSDTIGRPGARQSALAPSDAVFDDDRVDTYA